METKLKFKIGEFSRLCKVTVRTLRHYEKIGLLAPGETDRWTGYRYYTAAQMQTMGIIKRLKELGYTLEEIKGYLEEGGTPDEASLREKLIQTQEDLARMQRRISILSSLLDSQAKEKTMEKVYYESLAAITVASHREIIPDYNAIGRMCCEVIGPEMARLGCVCSQPGYCFTVEHGEYSPTNVDIEYCEQVEKACKDSDIIKFKELPAVQKAICMKHYGPYDTIYESYMELFSIIEQRGLKVAGQPRASYVDGAWNRQDPQEWLTVIQIPVE